MAAADGLAIGVSGRVGDAPAGREPRRKALATFDDGVAPRSRALEKKGTPAVAKSCGKALARLERGVR